jgi:hypothetical protein
VFHVRADDPHDAFAADDLAVFADPPNACSDLHDCTCSIKNAVPNVESEIIDENRAVLNFRRVIVPPLKRRALRV